MRNTRRLLPLALTFAASLAACAEPPDGSISGDDIAISLFALTGGVDGASFYPPLGDGPVITGPFDGTLLDALGVELQATDPSGATRTVARFDRTSSPALRLMSAFEVYMVDLAAAAYFTDATSSYRFRVELDGRELAFSDLSGRVFDVLAANPTLRVGVKVRLESRAVPSISTLTPSAADRGDGQLTMTIVGSGFASDSVARFGGLDLATTKLSSGTLTAVVPASSLSTAGPFDVTVFTPTPGGGTSNTLTFQVNEVGGIRAVTPIDFITTAEGGLFSTYQIDSLALDWDQDYGYFLRSSSDATQAGLRRFRISTMQEDRQATMASITGVTPNNFPASLHSDGRGSLFVVPGSSNSRPIIRIDAGSMTEAARFGIASSGLSNTTGRLVATTWMGATANGFLVTGSLFDDIAILRTSDMAYVWGSGQHVDESRVRGVVAGASGEAWILGSNRSTHTVVALYHVVVASDAHFDALLGTIGVTVTKVATFAPGEIDASATLFWQEAGGLAYDETDGSVIFQAQVASGTSAGAIHTVKWRNGQIVWNVVTPILINYEGPFESQNRLRGGRWTLMRGFRIIQLDTATGATRTDERLTVSEGGAQAFDGGGNRHVVKTDQGWTRIDLR